MRHGFYLEVVRIRGVQRDLVVTGCFFIRNWFKLYKYKLG